MNTIGFLETIWQDVRYGTRLLRLNPAFALVAIVSLALGIGANTAIFQLIDAVRLRALPVEAPHELVDVTIADMDGARGNFLTWRPSVTNPIWERLRDRQQSFAGIFAWSTRDLNLAQGGEVRNARSLWVSGAGVCGAGVCEAFGFWACAANVPRTRAHAPTNNHFHSRIARNVSLIGELPFG